MGGVEGFAADAVEKVAAQRFFRCKTDGVDQTVQTVPVFAQIGEGLVDFVVVGDVAAEHQFRTEFGRHFTYAFFQFVHNVGKGQIRALIAAGFGDAVSDGTFGNHARNQNFFALQKAHCLHP